MSPNWHPIGSEFDVRGQLQSKIVHLLDRSLVIAISLIMVATCGETAIADPNLDRRSVEKYLPDDAQFVVVANLKQILEHPVVKKNYFTKLKELVEGNAQVNGLLNLFALDPLRDISSVVLAGANVSPTGDNLLVVVHGQFSERQIKAVLAQLVARKACAQHIIKNNPRYAYYEFKQQFKPPAFLAMAGTRSLMLSPNEEYVVDAALKATGQKKTAIENEEFRDLLANVDTGGALWTVMLGNALVTKDQTTAEDLYGISAIRGGLILKDKLEIALMTDLKDTSWTQRFAASIQVEILKATGFLINAAKERNEFSPLFSTAQELVNGIEAKTNGRVVSLKSKVGFAKLTEGQPSGDALVPAEKRDLYHRLLRSTVWVVDTKSGSGGAGSLIHLRNRLVLTCYHVVGKAKEVSVVFPDYQGDKLIVERDSYLKTLRVGQGIGGSVIAVDKKRDLALVQLKSTPEHAAELPLAAESAFPTQPVHSIGNPNVGGLWIYTSGAVRQTMRRQITDKATGLTVQARMILTDSPTNPGDSGGPLVNDQGQLLGVTQSIMHDVRRTTAFIDISEIEAFLEINRTTLAAEKKYKVWVYKWANGKWVIQDDRNLTTSSAERAREYTERIKKYRGWTATTNAP